ncbi:MAG: hypothetical protein M1821_002357 [Bathelium mastoideum]|nr:MAG: hypothetical protein M1821_002357 [Bathelium mastoideum]KAI9686439.1 MAG: hypothetical protein M1822_003786 [Bathelium mastoideum]
MTPTLHKPRRPKTRLLAPHLEQTATPTISDLAVPQVTGLPAPPSDGPPIPNEVDIEIARHNGSSLAVDATRERLQAAKFSPTPSLSQIIEELTRENGRLRRELAFRHRLDRLGHDLHDEAGYIIERLRMALINFRQGQKDIETEFRTN